MNAKQENFILSLFTFTSCARWGKFSFRIFNLKMILEMKFNFFGQFQFSFDFVSDVFVLESRRASKGIRRIVYFFPFYGIIIYMVKLTKFEHKMLSHVSSRFVSGQKPKNWRKKFATKKVNSEVLCNDHFQLNAIIISSAFDFETKQFLLQV